MRFFRLGMCGVLVAASLVACLGCGSSSTQSSTTGSEATLNKASGSTNACRTRAARLTGTKPARIISGNSSPYGEAVIGPVRNAWAASVGDRSTTVYAGGQGYSKPDQGKFLIARTGSAPKIDAVSVSRAGALKIVKAPVGCAAVGWAQKRGDLQFTSTNGVAGTLHLEDDSVTIDQ